jgi:hypothetical protein
MRPFGTVILIVVVALLLSAGCIQPSPVTIPPHYTPQITPAAALVTTPATEITAIAPEINVTIIHYVIPVKAWKDTELRFAFEAPQDWMVKTRQLSLPEGSQGLEYQTDLVSDDIFYIRTYPISRNQDQAYRDAFRKWQPAPGESTVTYNNIVYERFESIKDGKTQIGYVARKSSANDLGFDSVLVFTVDASHSFEKEDFEKVVASFAFFTKNKASAVPGDEIPRVS